MFSYVYKTVWIDLVKTFRLTFLPPLMVYFAAGASGLTGIAATFYVKDKLDLSAEFLAGLGFWTLLPWALKIPIGHLVDILWRFKSIFIFIGAFCITLSTMIMYYLLTDADLMNTYMSASSWFVLSALLSPIGFVLQDVVADAMTVEAVPKMKDRAFVKNMHVTMQTLGRFSVLLGGVVASIINMIMFDGDENLAESIYARLYLYALGIPILSILGIVLAYILNSFKNHTIEFTKPNYKIIVGSLLYVLFSISMGLSSSNYAQEIVFIGSLGIISYLIYELIIQLEPDARDALVKTAFVIFMFRATPGVGPGMSWFEIDELGFDQYFLSKLSLIATVFTLIGMLLLRDYMAKASITKVIIVLTIFYSIMFLPNIGLFYGLHKWTSSVTSGVVDARFIAILDTAIESPLGQMAMIPMLAWIANNATGNLKATFFAVFASFTNLALSLSSLMTKYLNKLYTVKRQIVSDAGHVVAEKDYSELGFLLVTVLILSILMPIGAILLTKTGRKKL